MLYVQRSKYRRVVSQRVNKSLHRGAIYIIYFSPFSLCSISDDFISVNQNLSSEHWNHEDGYNNEVPVDPMTYPFRVLGPGSRAGMQVLMFLIKQNLEYICRGPVPGFKILLHTPGEVPQVSKHFFRIPLEQEVMVAIKLNMITTSEGLRHYEPNRYDVESETF